MMKNKRSREKSVHTNVTYRKKWLKQNKNLFSATNFKKPSVCTWCTLLNTAQYLLRSPGEHHFSPYIIRQAKVCTLYLTPNIISATKTRAQNNTLQSDLNLISVQCLIPIMSLITATNHSSSLSFEDKHHKVLHMIYQETLFNKSTFMEEKNAITQQLMFLKTSERSAWRSRSQRLYEAARLVTLAAVCW